MATERRLIDADALLKQIDFEYDLNYGEILTDPRYFAEMVEDAPTVDAVEVVHGRWLTVEEGLFHGTREKCSLCGLQKNRGLVYHYCPNCGAKMDGDGNG